MAQKTRVSRPAEVRRAEILDAAARRFEVDGYRRTSVQQILDDVGIARGTFYHHFRAKEDVLRELVERQLGCGEDRARAVMAQPDLDVPTRLLLLVLAQRPQGEEAAIVTFVEEHPELHRYSSRAAAERVLPMMVEVVTEGVAQGVFDTSYPREATGFLLQVLVPALDDETGLSEEQLAHRAAAAVDTCERVLGAAPGSLARLVEIIGQQGLPAPTDHES